MVKKLAARAKEASSALMTADTKTKNTALEKIASALVENASEILSENASDIRVARENGLSEAMVERLTLSDARIAALSESIRQVAALPDPIGGITSTVRRPNGLTILQRRVPLGVIGLIYESRPNVTVDSAALCLKAGNACLLRGGKEALRSNTILVRLMREAVGAAGLPEDSVCFVEDTSRQSALDMMELTGLLDVLIPRGGSGLIKSVVENSRVPVIETGSGVCHAYVDSDADLKMAEDIVVNAKCSRPSVCNAVETLLVARSVAGQFLQKLKPRLDAYNVELRGCPESCRILEGINPASEDDWRSEYSDFILAVRVVGGMYEATAHINKYGTRHSDVIITNNYFTANRFIDRVDSACVYVNASTRFTDGGEFGMGAEIGISTQKLHARGPFALEHLTSYKYVVLGEGQIR